MKTNQSLKAFNFDNLKEIGMNSNFILYLNMGVVLFYSYVKFKILVQDPHNSKILVWYMDLECAVVVLR